MFPINFEIEAVVPVLEIYVITRHLKPDGNRFKLVNLEGLTEEQKTERLINYSRTYRLVQVIETSDLMRQVCISPEAPFAEDLQSCENLTIGGKKVSHVQILTKEEYDDFTAQALATVVASSKKVSSEEKSQTKGKDVSLVIQTVSARKAPRNVFCQVKSTSLDIVQNCFHEAIMTILKTIEESQRRIAELAKEKIEEKREKRRLIKEIYEHTCYIVYDIKKAQINKDALHQLLMAVK